MMVLEIFLLPCVLMLDVCIGTYYKVDVHAQKLFSGSLALVADIALVLLLLVETESEMNTGSGARNVSTAAIQLASGFSSDTVVMRDSRV